MANEESFIGNEDFSNIESQESLIQPTQEAFQKFISLFIFRVNNKWLALETNHVKNVAHSKLVHKLPHQKNPILSGIVSWNGELVLVISLDLFLNFDNPSEVSQDHSCLPKNWMIAIEKKKEIRVFFAEEVIGVQLFPVSDISKSAKEEINPNSSNLKRKMTWNGLDLVLIDGEAIFKFLNRNGL